MFLNVYFDVFGIVFLLKHHPDDCFNVANLRGLVEIEMK